MVNHSSPEMPAPRELAAIVLILMGVAVVAFGATQQGSPCGVGPEFVSIAIGLLLLGLAVALYAGFWGFLGFGILGAAVGLLGVIAGHAAGCGVSI